MCISDAMNKKMYYNSLENIKLVEDLLVRTQLWPKKNVLTYCIYGMYMFKHINVRSCYGTYYISPDQIS